MKQLEHFACLCGDSINLCQFHQNLGDGLYYYSYYFFSMVSASHHFYIKITEIMNLYFSVLNYSFSQNLVPIIIRKWDLNLIFFYRYYHMSVIIVICSKSYDKEAIRLSRISSKIYVILHIPIILDHNLQNHQISNIFSYFFSITA